jgi:glycosyltransferase involved in cell wall biosynthesis
LAGALERWRTTTARLAAAVETVIVVPLGEIAAADVEAAIQRHFGPTDQVDILDRTQLRRRPLATLARLLRRRYRTAVLVAPDLRQRRLQLTSLVLGLTPATKRWRIDLLGGREAFHFGGHLARHGPAMVRHMAACVLALILAEPLLRWLDWLIKPRSRDTLSVPSRVLYLRSQFWFGLEGGGSVAHTAGVIGGLQQLGTEVQVVSSDRLPGVVAPIAVVPPETWFDGKLREVEELVYNTAFFLAALHAARRTRPQVIYQRHTGFNCSGAVLSRVLGLPLVLEFNSSELWKGRFWGGLTLWRAATLVERINLRAADMVVVVSRVLRDQLIDQGVPENKILINPNAVDPALFRPDIDATPVRDRQGFDSSVVVIGFSGTFGLWHGIRTLAEVLQLVLTARPDVRWLLIGDGPLRHIVDQAICEHGLGDRVRFAGLVPHAEMPAYLAACDVLVSPHGRQADGGEFFGSPTKLFEYMAAGRPIVASAVGQIAETLLDDETALLVPPDDPVALCQAIVRLVDDPDLRARLAEGARRSAEQHHTWRQNAERVLARCGAGAAWSP